MLFQRTEVCDTAVIGCQDYDGHWCCLAWLPVVPNAPLQPVWAASTTAAVAYSHALS